MIISLVAATLTAAQPAAAPPAVDHSKMDMGAKPAAKMDMGKMDMGSKPAAKMDCCKDGCACCAKMKDKPAA